MLETSINEIPSLSSVLNLIFYNALCWLLHAFLSHLQLFRPSWAIVYAVLSIAILSHSITGQQFDPADFDYSDFSNFRGVASPVALPPLSVQRQRGPVQQSLQPSTRGELPRRDDSRRSGNPGRGEAVPQDVDQRDAPKPVAILKQISE